MTMERLSVLLLERISKWEDYLHVANHFSCTWKIHIQLRLTLLLVLFSKSFALSLSEIVFQSLSVPCMNHWVLFCRNFLQRGSTGSMSLTTKEAITLWVSYLCLISCSPVFRLHSGEKSNHKVPLPPKWHRPPRYHIYVLDISWSRAPPRMHLDRFPSPLLALVSVPWPIQSSWEGVWCLQCVPLDLLLANIASLCYSAGRVLPK